MKNMRLAVEVSEAFHQAVHQHARSRGMSVKDFVTQVLIERIQQDHVNEDEVWGELAEQAKQDGMATQAETLDIIQSIKNA